MRYKICMLLISISFLGSCKTIRSDGAIYIHNNSGKSIYWSMSGLYPDTTIAPISYSVNIDSGQTKGPYSYLLSSSGVIELFLFDNSVLGANPWDSVVSKYLILKRYDLTQDSIVKLNSIITYP
jgi:hypothetical protein